MPRLNTYCRVQDIILRMFLSLQSVGELEIDDKISTNFRVELLRKGGKFLALIFREAPDRHDGGHALYY